MQLKNDLLIRAAKGEKTERTPVWLMRQAGRILPEYREVRNRIGGFKELVTTPELAAEVTLQPVDILGVDAAIIFSDILVIPEAMGLPYQMLESKGPWFEKTITSEKDIDALQIAQGGELHYVTEAIGLVKKELNGRVPLIGFAGAPWTIFSYMIEGRGSKTFSQAKKFLYTEPRLAHKLLDKITQSTINYLKAQVHAGADIIQIFDSWAGILSPEQYREFSLPYIGRICDALNPVTAGGRLAVATTADSSLPDTAGDIYTNDTDNQTPVIVFAKGAFFARAEMSKLSCQVIGLDWNMDIAESRALIGNSKTLQGNMDPCLLYADASTIRKETEKMLATFGPQRHIANLGHGLYPDINPDNVKCFIDTVKEYRFNV